MYKCVVALTICIVSYVNTHGLSDEWYKCHGMKCDDLENLVRKPMNELKKKWAREQGLEYNEEPGPQDDMVGDVWMTPELVEAIRETELPRHKRKLHLPNAFREKWPMPIRYQFDGNHTSEEMNNIRAAIHHWEAQTCIRFSDRTGAPYEKEGIIFTREAGCASFIGFNWLEQPQPVDLITWCTDRLGTIAHEIGHVIGFWHEHQRSDRNDFVSIIANEVKYGIPYYQSILRRATNTRNWQPYDYTSAMHYWSKSGSKSGDITIKTKEKLFQRAIGQATGLSFLDVKTANQEYCNTTCKNVKLPRACQQGGYQDPNNCRQCKCPDGLGGTYCDQLESSSRGCGGQINLRRNERTFRYSPGYYSAARRYRPRQQCNWKITAPLGSKVSIRFEGEFGVACASKGPTCVHWVEVKHKNELWKPGPRFCCEDTPKTILTSESNSMVVIFKSNFTYGVDCDDKPESCRGFKFIVAAEEPSSSTSEKPRPTTRPTVTTQRPTQKPTTKPTKTTPPENDGYNCGTMDLAIVMDSSGKTGRDQDWEMMVDFVKKFVLMLHIHRTGVNVGIVIYSNHGHLVIPLNRYQSNESLSQAINIRNLPFKDQMTNTADGLRVMRRQLFTKENGDRDFAPNVALLLTEGQSNRGQMHILKEADKARENKIIVFAIGITRGVKRSELEAIVADNSERFITYLTNMGELERSRYKIKTKLCNELGLMGGNDKDHRRPETSKRPLTTSQRPPSTPPPTRKPYIVRREYGPFGECSATCGGCGTKRRSIYCVYSNNLREWCEDEVRACADRDITCSCCKYIAKYYCRENCKTCCPGYREEITSDSIMCVRY